MMHIRFPLSPRQAGDFLCGRRIVISHAIVRAWWDRLGPMVAAEIGKKRSAANRYEPRCRWHLDEDFVRITGETYDVGRAVDHDGEVLEEYATT